MHAEPLSRSEAFSMFKMYEDKGWAVKQQVNTIVTLLAPVIFGLLAFFAKEFCCSSTSPMHTANLASGTVVLSIFLVLLIFGSLRHADQDYQKADEVMEQTKHLFPKTTLNTMYQNRPQGLRWLGRCLLRLGMPRIGGVHIFIMYLCVFLVGLSVTAWNQPIKFLSKLCPDAGKYPELVRVADAALCPTGHAFHLTR
jgi:hypothetical protein